MEWNLSEILSYVLYLLSDKRILILVIVLFVSILFVVFSLILYFRTRRRHLQKKHENESNAEEVHPHLQEIVKLRKINNPKEALSELGKDVKQISMESLKTEKEMTFGEISEKLREKNKTSLADFCNEIEYLTYSEEEPTKNKIKELVDKFEKALKPKKQPKEKETGKKKQEIERGKTKSQSGKKTGEIKNKSNNQLNNAGMESIINKLEAIEKKINKIEEKVENKK
ncbi:MAG TPA: hypothetical protein VMZ91_00235 [Candidatus Paceibacterota bacterium]|nr:hypothetical protein [Candidatus Paceibacterota bacterium]